MLSENLHRDLVICTLRSGELAVVDWDRGGLSYDANQRATEWNPGLRLSRLWVQDSAKDTTNSLGRFVKASREYTPCKFDLI